MRDPSERPQQPLPTEWLPDPQPPAGSPELEAMVERIMAAAEPELRALDSPRTGTWSIIGRWRKPAAVLAVAATGLLLLLERPPLPPQPQQRSLPLSLIAADGDPISLWEAFGIRADTVLALIAMQAGQEVEEQQSRPGSGLEENR